MKNRDLLLTEEGDLKPCTQVSEWKLLKEYYRFYRFLTEVEDVFEKAAEKGTDEINCLPEIRRLVRQLTLNSYWIQTQDPEPCSQTGTSVIILYDEIGFPWTVQVVKFLPGTASTIHTHGAWGVVVILKGQEKNTFWKRGSEPEFPNKIERVGETVLMPGDLISFTPDAIHSIESVGDEPTITFNIYGETDSSRRFEFDPIAHTAKKF